MEAEMEKHLAKPETWQAFGAGQEAYIKGQLGGTPNCPYMPGTAGYKAFWQGWREERLDLIDVIGDEI